MIKKSAGSGAIKIAVTVFAALAVIAAAFLSGFYLHKYTQPEQVNSYQWVVDTIKENYYYDLSDEEIFYSSMAGVSNVSLDPYSEYYTKEEYENVYSSNSGNRRGVGISYTFIDNDFKNYHPQSKGGVLISSVIGGSPAFISGLRAGEFITAVKYGGVTHTFASSDEFSDCIDSIPDNTDFVLVSDRNESGYTVSKQDYRESYCVMYTATAEYSIVYENGTGHVVIDEEKGLNSVLDGASEIAELTDGVAYLRLDQFFGNCANEMAALIGYFNAERCTSLIFDLRSNGGGYADDVCVISDIFTGELDSRNPVAMCAEYKNKKKTYFYVEDRYSGNQQLPKGTKVSVLADNGTASASEAMIGVLIDNGVIDYGDIYISDFDNNYVNYMKAVYNNPDLDIKNKRTYGKGIMQTTFINDDTGEALKLTTAKIYWPKGETCIHDVGLTAQNGCNLLPAKWDVQYGDPQLKEAIKTICGR